jgi:hypothetical protein
MDRYCLSSHVHLCFIADQAIFLDLRRDRYQSIHVEPPAVGLLTRIAGRASSSERELGAALLIDRKCRTLLRELLEAGLVQPTSVRSTSLKRIILPPADETIDSVRGRFPRISGRDFINFVSSLVATYLRLKLCSIENLTRRLACKRGHLSQGELNKDLLELHRLTVAYFVLRPNFFSATDACLRDSLTFIDFIGKYGFVPHLVFGVRVGPFSAHCWVQQENMVLNDYIEHVRSYEMILVV